VTRGALVEAGGRAVAWRGADRSADLVADRDRVVAELVLAEGR
jgi:hypothetical protein